MGKRNRGVRASLRRANEKYSFWRSRFVFLLLLLSSISLRLYLINLRKFPAGDEIWGYLDSKTDLKTVWIGALSEFHAPFYFLFLRVLKLISPFEFNIFSMRYVSLFFGLIGNFAIWNLASKVLGKNRGLAVFYLSLFLPGFIWSAIYGRYYSFLILLTTVSIIIFLKFLKKADYTSVFLLSVVSAIGIYTHYYFALIDVGFLVFILLKNEYRFLFKKWFLALSQIALFCFPLAFLFLTLPKPDMLNRHYTYNDLSKIPAILITNLASWETFLYLFYQGKPILYIPVVIALWTATAFLLIYAFLSWRDKTKLLYFCLFFTPGAITVVLAYTLQPSFLALGSLIIFLPPLLLIIGKGIGFNKNWIGVISTVFLLSIFFSLIFFFQSSKTYSIPRLDFNLISADLQDKDIVVNSHLYAFIMSSYYLGSKVTIYGIQDEITSTFLTQKALGYKVITAESLSRLNNRIWYLEPYFGISDEAKKIKQTLDNNFKLVKQEIFIPDKAYKENFTFFNVYLYVPVNQ